MGSGKSRSRRGSGGLLAVVVEDTGDRIETGDDVEEAIHVARDLLARARDAGYRVPRARFFVAGELVREATRTDLAIDLGRCWCGRGALRGKPGEGWCCAKHESLWGEMSRDVRSRVIVARFLRIYGGGRQ